MQISTRHHHRISPWRECGIRNKTATIPRRRGNSSRLSRAGPDRALEQPNRELGYALAQFPRVLNALLYSLFYTRVLGISFVCCCFGLFAYRLPRDAFSSSSRVWNKNNNVTILFYIRKFESTQVLKINITATLPISVCLKIDEIEFPAVQNKKTQ